MVPEAFIRVSESDSYRGFLDLMQRGIDLLGGDDAPGADRLRDTRDFYAFISREFPRLIDQFKRERKAKHDG